MLIVTIKPLRLMNIVKTRSKAVTHNRFVRCLMSHFDFLQDETSNMNQATTILFMLANLYIQVVPTNNVVDSCLSLILGSQRWVPLIFVVCITVTVVLICLMLASLFFEQIYLANSSSSTLGKPKHLTSPWYRLYKHLYRFHFLVSEPILSGYAISFVYPHDPIEASFLPYHYCGVVSGLIGLLLSLPYLFFVESILPNSSITSASNRVNIGLTAMSLRLCLFVDAYYVGTTSLTTIFVLMMGRLLPSIIATYVNLFDTHFFNKYSRLVMVGFQVSNIVYSLIFYIMGNNSVTPTLVPACLFIAIGWRLVHNMDTRERTNLRNLSVNKLDDVLSFWSQLMDQANSITGTASMNALRFQAVMAHLTRSNQGQFEEYTDNFATTEEKSQDQACNPNFFMVYLFERNWRNSGEKDFKTLAYETLWAVYVRSNIFHLSVMLARLNTLDLNIVEKSTYRAVLRRVEEYTTEVYQEKMSLVPSKEQFYAPKTITEMNETAATKARFTAVDDDSKDGIDQTRTILPTLTRKSEMIHFDIYSSMITIEKYEKLVENMQEVISTILKFYEKLKNRVVEIASAHDTMKLVKRLKESVNKNFHYLDKMSGEQNLFHLLPYALFLEIINNDRQASQKVLKAYEFRSQQLERSLQMARSLTISNKFSLDLMLCIGVDCTRSSLGRMNYVSSNCVEVFRVPKKHFDSRNISCLMTDDFQPIHNDFMDKFVRDQDKPYLGISHERHVRIREHIYARCDVLVKLSPVLHSSMLSFMCLLKKHVSDEEFIVLNHQGVIVGRSQALEWADSMILKSYGILLASLADRTAERRIRSLLLRNNAIMSRTLQTLKLLESKAGSPILSDILKQNVPISLAILPPPEEEEAANGPIIGEEEGKVRVLATYMKYGGRRLFTDILLKFRANLFSRHSDSQSGSTYQNFSNGIGPGEPRDKQIASELPDLKVAESTHANKTKDVQNSKLIMKPSVQNNLVRTDGKHFKFSSSKRIEPASHSSSNGVLETEFPKLSKPRRNGRELPTQQVSKISDNEPGLHTGDGQSSHGSTVGTGSMQSTHVKAKVLATIRHQRKSMAWKELLAILILMVLIWSFRGYIESLLNDSFGRKLRDLIDLRTGFGSLLMLTGSSFNSGITMLERMLVLRDQLSTSIYEPILPSIVRSVTAVVSTNIASMQSWSIRLTAHIYGFNYDLSQRYLTEKYNYTYVYYGEDQIPGPNQTMTKSIDLLDHARECINVMKQWSAAIDAEGADFRFSNILVAKYYELMSSAWTAVSLNTMDNILDEDTKSYQKVVVYVTNLTHSTIAANIVMASIVVILFWALRRKLIRLYSILENLLPFEVSLMQERYSKVLDTLKQHKYSKAMMEKKTHKMGTADDIIYSQRRQASINSRAYFKTKTAELMWFGFGWVCILEYLIIFCYQIVEYTTVNNLTGKLDRLLELQAQQRTLLTTTNVLSAIHFNSYLMVVKAAGYGTRSLPSLEQFSETLDLYAEIFEENSSLLDDFITQVPLHKEEFLNFGDFLTAKPCDYMNYKRFLLPRSECESLADFTMNKSIIATFTWTRLMMPSFIHTLKNLTALSDPLDFLIGREFLNFQFVRRNFLLQFAFSFTTDFFDRLKAYHQTMFVKTLQSTLTTSLALSVSLSIVVAIFAIVAVLGNIDAALQVFLLVPFESYYHNPHIAAKLLTITQ